MTRRCSALLRVGVGFVAVSLGCGSPTDDVSGEPGQPIAGLAEAELGRFLLGKAVFERLTTPEEGLGPLYNETRCSGCHSIPAAGGSGRALVTKATRYDDGVCDLLVGEGGDNIQRLATPLLADRGITSESIPASANAHVDVTGPPLFGLGLVETIPVESILSREDPDDGDGDGISGRAGRTESGAVGRFGRKGEVATIFDFSDTALRFELGLTTAINPVEETVNGAALPPGVDPMPEPEIDERGMNLLADFIRFLAPPAREVPATDATRDSIVYGGAVFEDIGCASCHVPTMQTGPSETDGLSRKIVNLYSDWLLHDLGPVLGDVCGADASPSEYRTAPLWGLRHRTALLHDGRAATTREAIEFHAGEAAGARTAFAQLSVERQELLLRFLGSL